MNENINNKELDKVLAEAGIGDLANEVDTLASDEAGFLESAIDEVLANACNNIDRAIKEKIGKPLSEEQESALRERVDDFVYKWSYKWFKENYAL